MPRVSYKARREFAKEMLEYAFFGAFHLAIKIRKKEESLTAAQLGSRMGREKTGISKLLSGPRNWQLSTISDLSEALGVRLEFSFVDKHFPSRRFTATGVVYDTAMVGTLNAALPPINASNAIEQNVRAPILQYNAVPFGALTGLSMGISKDDSVSMKQRQLPFYAPPPVIPLSSPAPTIIGGAVAS